MRKIVMLSAGVLSATILALTMLPTAQHESAKIPLELDRKLWDTYRDSFINDGRVIDSYQGGISHSEGQGYGMLLAEAAGDRGSFDKLWDWTQRVLQRKDGLFAWRYEHCPKKDRSCITDSNNASDGEILIAWALLRASRRWNDDSYYQHAYRIARTVSKKLLVRRHGRLFILPGSKGFMDDNRITLNVSYWVFPALEAFSREFEQPLWEEVIASGKWLLAEGRFGVYQLPPDWIVLENDKLVLSTKFPQRYSFDAVRIPLYQAWSMAGISRTELASYHRFWSHTKPPPAWINLKSGEGSSFSWNTGMAAIASLARHRAGLYNSKLKLPRPKRDDGYYAWSLTLLCYVAAKETVQ